VPVECGAKWEYTYTNYYKLGSNCARHDDNCLYELPYSRERNSKSLRATTANSAIRVQSVCYRLANAGRDSHPAARGGVVVRVKDNSDKGGPSMDYDRFKQLHPHPT